MDAERRQPRTRPGGRRSDDPPAEWLSISDYARCYGIDRAIVYKWLKANILDTYKVGSLTRVRNLPPDQHEKYPSAHVDGC